MAACPPDPACPLGHPARRPPGGARQPRRSSVLVTFQAEGDGYGLRSYCVQPENRPLPAELTGRLRTLAQTMIDESLPRGGRHPGKQGTRTWTLETDRFVIGNERGYALAGQ